MNDREIEEVMEKVRDRVKQWARKFPFLRNEVEDLTNQSFIKILSNEEKYDESKAQYMTWVYNLTNQSVLTYLRKSMRHQRKYAALFRDMSSLSGDVVKARDYDDKVKNLSKKIGD